MAKSITRRTLLGFRDGEANLKTFIEMVNQFTNKQKELVERITRGQVFKRFKDMKFNAIVGNPPYQLTGASGGNNDAPIFQHFCEVASKLQPNYASLIIPSRWFAAGRENLLGTFRNYMLNSGTLSRLITYTDSNRLFTNVEIKGGVCYFLQDQKHDGDCLYTLHRDDESITKPITLNDFDILIREPILAGLVKKVLSLAKKEDIGFVDSLISNDTPFGIPSNPRTSSKTPFSVYDFSSNAHNTLLFHIENNVRKVEYVKLSDIKKNAQDVTKNKVFIPGGYGAGESFPHQILGVPEIAPSNSVCSQSYLYAAFDTEEQAISFVKYLKSRTFRALVCAIKITQSAPQRVYKFVPLQDFTAQSDIDWSKSIPEIDQQLYTKYNLSVDEIAFIEKMIKPMD